MGFGDRETDSPGTLPLGSEAPWRATQATASSYHPARREEAFGRLEPQPPSTRLKPTGAEMSGLCRPCQIALSGTREVLLFQVVG